MQEGDKVILRLKSKWTVHCIHCGRTYTDWQYEDIIQNGICVNCGETIIFSEEIYIDGELSGRRIPIKNIPKLNLLSKKGCD